MRLHTEHTNLLGMMENGVVARLSKSIKKKNQAATYNQISSFTLYPITPEKKGEMGRVSVKK